MVRRRRRSCDLRPGACEGAAAALISHSRRWHQPSSSTPARRPPTRTPSARTHRRDTCRRHDPGGAVPGEPKRTALARRASRTGTRAVGQLAVAGQTGPRNTTAPAVLAPAALPPAVAAAPPAALPGLPLAPGLGLPALGGAFAPSALAGGSLPGGLSSSLFGANFGNPALLAGTPLGAAATSLYQPQADSAVTTVSHSEALAAGAQRGIGTPTAIAAIALAGVVGILVRSRVLRRIARREPVGAYPFEEALEVDSAAVEPAPADDVVAEARPLMAA